MASSEFKDYYAVFGGSPQTAQEELKKIYYERIRQFHPDKRPDEAADGLGAKITKELNEGWEILRDKEKRQAYDQTWEAEQEKKIPPAKRAEKRRQEGNELYKQAKAAESDTSNFSSAADALQKYQAAIAKYTEGIDYAPHDHRLRSNRALCYQALKDWSRCREDAQVVTQVKPDFMKGWFLLVKALMKEGSHAAAQRELDTALQLLPSSPELKQLQDELTYEQAEKTGAINRELNASQRPKNAAETLNETFLGETQNNKAGETQNTKKLGRMASLAESLRERISRSVSPCITPTTPRARSRAGTPPRIPTKHPTPSDQMSQTTTAGTSTPPRPTGTGTPPRPSSANSQKSQASTKSPGPRPPAYRERSKSPTEAGAPDHPRSKSPTGATDPPRQRGTPSKPGLDQSFCDKSMTANTACFGNTMPSVPPTPGTGHFGTSNGMFGRSGPHPFGDSTAPRPPRQDGTPPKVPPGARDSFSRKESTHWHDDHTPPRRRVGPSLGKMAKEGRTFADQVGGMSADSPKPH